MSREEANQIVREAQRLRRSKRVLKIALPTAAALDAGAAIAVGSIPGGNGVITGCYAASTGAYVGVDGEYHQAPGALRVIDPSLAKTGTTVGGPPIAEPARECSPEETQITWNQSGPTGPTGLTGATGPTGQQGGQGSSGQDGAPGSSLIGETTFGMHNEAGSIFLKIDGLSGETAIKGESTIKGEAIPKSDAGYLKIDSFSLGAHGTSNIGSQSSGAGAGKATFETFTITKQIDSASPTLFQAAATGKHFPDATLFFTHKAKGGQQQNYLEIKLFNLGIATIQDGASSSGAPEEQVTFNFLKIEETYLQNKGAPVTVGWDLATNKAL